MGRFRKVKQRLVSYFLEIAVGETDETARQFLEATSWKLEEAVELFYITITPTRPHHLASQSLGDFIEKFKSSKIWERDESISSASTSDSASAPRDSLASLYRPPFHLMFRGSFEQAKAASFSQDKWLLVNLQSNTEFSSHMLNRDIWANGAVSQTIEASFTFWQIYDDTTEGKRVCTFYKLESIPAVLVIDPTTGQKMKMWSGIIEPATLLEDLVPFLDSSPLEHLASPSKKLPRSSFSLTPHSKPKDEDQDEDENMKESSDDQPRTLSEEVVVEAVTSSCLTSLDSGPSLVTTMVLPKFPPLPQEPKGGDRSVQCRVGIRLPNGQRLQRNFLKTDSIQLLWSFCYSELEESERKKPLLNLTQGIPGESKRLDYESNLTWEQSGVANSMISASWE